MREGEEKKGEYCLTSNSNYSKTLTHYLTNRQLILNTLVRKLLDLLGPIFWATLRNHLVLAILHTTGSDWWWVVPLRNRCTENHIAVVTDVGVGALLIPSTELALSRSPKCKVTSYLLPHTSYTSPSFSQLLCPCLLLLQLRNFC